MPTPAEGDPEPPRPFMEDLQPLLYACGAGHAHHRETLQYLGDLTLAFLQDMGEGAAEEGRRLGRPPAAEDLLATLTDETQRLRAAELLAGHHRIAAARQCVPADLLAAAATPPPPRAPPGDLDPVDADGVATAPAAW
eukprot:EG_transcript_36994